MVEPIKPDDVLLLKAKIIPPEVIQAFNNLIVKKYDGCSAYIKQPEVVNEILKLMGMDYTVENKSKIFYNHWLDIENFYRKAGWKVLYDTPDYNESGDALFKFSKKD